MRDKWSVPGLHAEHAEARVLGGAVGGDGEGEAEDAARVGGVDDAVVPEAGGRVVGVALALVLLADRRLESFLVVLRPLPALRLDAVTLDGREHGSGLLAAHHRDARVGPRPEEARIEGAPAHAVVPRAERAAEDHRELRYSRARHRGHHLRAVLGDAAAFVLAAHHEAGDVLQEEERDAALAGELDEVRALERGLGEEDAVVREDAHRTAVNVREPGDERRTVERLELVEFRAVDEAGDDLADVERDFGIGGNDSVEIFGWIKRIGSRTIIGLRSPRRRMTDDLPRDRERMTIILRQ